MIVRLVGAAGQTLGEASTKDELLAIVEREAPPMTVIEAREAETGDVVDLEGVTFEGTGLRNLVVEYVPARQQLERLKPEVCAYIDRLLDSATRIAFALRAGRQVGDSGLVPLLDGIEWVSRVGALAAQLAADTEGLGNGSADLVRECGGMRSGPSVFLEELQRALESRDPFELADILESGLAGWLEEERSWWQSMGSESS